MSAGPATATVSTIEPIQTAGTGESYVEWGAALAGAILASAISFVLLTFGGAIGLSLSSPYAGEGMSVVAFVIAAGLWVLWVQVFSFMAGGYLAGRMRKRLNDSTEHEVDVRDGAHGLLVWATGVVIGAALAFGGVGGAANTAARAAGSIVAATDSENAPLAGASLDLFRPIAGISIPADTAARAAALGVIARAAEKTLPEADRFYAVSVVVEQTGVTAEEAQARVATVHAQATQVAADAKKAAEAARKMSVIAAFFLAASLAVSAAAAYVAAGFGGNHRDKGLVIRYFARR